MLSTNELGNYIQAGAAEIPADTVIEHGTLVNVMTGEYYPTNVAIYQGRIVAVDQDITDYIGPNTKHIDATNQYLVPGLVDGHIHVECSKMSMTSFSQAVLPHGGGGPLPGGEGGGYPVSGPPRADLCHGPAGPLAGGHDDL